MPLISSFLRRLIGMNSQGWAKRRVGLREGVLGVLWGKLGLKEEGMGRVFGVNASL